jgi:hypothetical protein
MNTKLLYFMAVIGLHLVCHPANAQRRGVIWVHGLNSSGSEWSNWRDVFVGERQIFSRNQLSDPSTQQWINYESQNGVAVMANNVRNRAFS